MKPPAFDYHAPATVDEALTLASQLGSDAKFIAGGQSLMPMLNFRLLHPSHLIDLNGIAAMAYLRVEGGELRIGSMTRHREVELSPIVRNGWPLISECMPFVAHVQIRNRGTLGGSLSHADPAAELPAVMTALEANLALRSNGASRTLAAEDFFIGTLTTAAEPGELLIEVRVPALPRATGWAFDELSRRRGDFALVGAAALVLLNADGRIEWARLAFTGVGERPRSARQTEQALRGQLPNEDVIHAAAELSIADLTPELRFARERRLSMRRRQSDRAPHPDKSNRAIKGSVAMNKRKVLLEINGIPYEGEAEPRRLLSDFIREDLGLHGTHVGCEHGVCGACTIQWDGKAVRSCLVLAVQANGARLRTVEGLAPNDSHLHPIQQAFTEVHALQCGFCTPGILMTTQAMLRANPRPSEAEVRDELSGNLCRCTGYQNIVKAVLLAAEKLAQE